MGLFFAGAVLFFGTHFLPVFAGARNAIHDRLGDMPYRAVYGVIALVGFVLIVIGYGDWRFSGSPQIYDPPVWMRHLVLLLMIPVFPLLFAAYVPAGKIKVAVKHPMILAVKVWAFAHLFANGDLASLVLFLLFLAWGVIDRISLKRREAAGLVTVATEGAVRNDIIAITLGLVVYVLFVWRLHMWLIGVPVVG